MKRELRSLYSIKGYTPAGGLVWDLCVPTTFLGVLIFIRSVNRPMRWSVVRVGRARQAR